MNNMALTKSEVISRARRKLRNILYEGVCLAALVLLLGISAAAAAAAVDAVVDAHRANKVDSEWRRTLIEASKKSEAHHYFAYNWLQCKPLFGGRAVCLASIRTAAAIRGPEFLKRVDAVAIELGFG